MAFPTSRILSAKRLSQLMKESTETGERFCFILGSGASVESGIPSGNTLEMQWMNCLMGRMEDRGMPAMDPDETRRIAEALSAEHAIEHKFSELEDAWQTAKKEGRSIPSKYYFDIYKLRFHANPRKGYSYLEKIMESCEPSLGYHTLAKLLTENNLNNLVITTNFDSLVEDALFLYTDKKPLVVGHESLADYVDANIQRPIVAKVHRSLMYAPFNSPETTSELKAEWQKALSFALSIYTPIVIGYAGGDHSLMSFLEDKNTIIRNSVYWCYLGKPDPAGLPEANIQTFVENRNGYFIAIDGFDALMVEIGKTLYGDAIRPGLTAERLKEKHDRRVQQYNEQWDNLNKQPEIQEALQEMNAAEQQEEEQREKEQTLTAWDYFRRGFRANNEGRKDEAIAEYSKAIELDPKLAAAFNNRGIIYDDLEQYQKAIDDYNKAIELDPNYAVAYNNRGTIYDKLKQRQRALEDYDKAIELDPNYKTAYYNRGITYDDLEQPQKAIENFSKAIELDPNYTSAYYNRGNIYDDLGQHEKAIEDYNKAIELDSNYVIAYNNRGVAYKNLKQYEKAIQDYSKAIELDPNDATFYSNRGAAYKNLEQYDKAIEDYTRAIQIDPKYKKAYLNRADAYSAIGEEALAEADRKTAEGLAEES